MTSLKEAYARAKADIKGRLDGAYQHDGVKWMLQRELDEDRIGCHGGILADDMGLGKTMQAIAAMRGNPMSTLIISIVGTVNQWRDALIDFGGYKPIIVNPSFTGILPANVDVVVTTYSAFQKVKPLACLFKERWGRIVLDEGHMIRNAKTKLNVEISKLHADIKWILSGTPIQNSEKDIYALAKWIGGKSVSGMSIEDISRSLVLRRTQEQQAQISPRLALPPLYTHIVKLKFATKEERLFYEAVEDFFADKALEKGAEAMTSLTRCRQACTNPLLYNMAVGGKADVKAPKRRKRSDIVKWDGSGETTKVTYLVDDIEEHSKKGKCLIFCIWTEEMKFLTAALKERNIASLIYDGGLSRDNKEAVLYNFKNTTIPVLILQINCGSTGLNLQCANRVYITSPNWNPCVELQAIGRAYRKGQVDCVTCIRLVMEGTVEERCMEIQQNKMTLISEAMMDDSFQSRLGGVTEMEDVNITDIFKKDREKMVVECSASANIGMGEVRDGCETTLSHCIPELAGEVDMIVKEIIDAYGNGAESDVTLLDDKYLENWFDNILKDLADDGSI
jgi:SNF2 family DNA or RNA helicase